MTVVVVVLALILGILLPDLLRIKASNALLTQYMAIACLAGLDSLCGGIRAAMEGKFHNDVFTTGFFANIVIAFFLAWLGDQIGINLFLAAVIVMGGRIYTNLSLIRRFLLTKWKDARERSRLQQQQQQQAQSNL
jgi:small basic protein